MGIFSNLLKSGINSENSMNAMSTPVSQAAKQPAGVDLTKHKENLDRVVVNLSKSGGVDLTKHQARVAMVIDYSGSMSGMYSDGSVQKVVTRLLPLALRFDDNGELESWLFTDGKKRLKPITVDNYTNYVKKVMQRSMMFMGGTSYAPVLKDVIRYYTKEESSTDPAFVIFITDGANSDRYATDEIIQKSSRYNIFIQFVGIGRNDSEFEYLEKLDDLTGRECDNTGFIRAANLADMSDEALYTELLRQYKDWLNVRGR